MRPTLIYTGADIRFTLPDSWVDRSVVAFSSPPDADGASAITVVLSREGIAESGDIHGFATHQLAAITERLPGFQLRHRRASTVAGLPAVDLAFEWKAGQTAMHQRIVCFEGAKGQALMLTATSHRPAAAEMHAALEVILATIAVPQWS